MKISYILISILIILTVYIIYKILRNVKEKFLTINNSFDTKMLGENNKYYIIDARGNCLTYENKYIYVKPYDNSNKNQLWNTMHLSTTDGIISNANQVNNTEILNTVSRYRKGRRFRSSQKKYRNKQNYLFPNISDTESFMLKVANSSDKYATYYRNDKIYTSEYITRKYTLKLKKIIEPSEKKNATFEFIATVLVPRKINNDDVKFPGIKISNIRNKTNIFTILKERLLSLPSRDNLQYSIATNQIISIKRSYSTEERATIYDRYIDLNNANELRKYVYNNNYLGYIVNNYIKYISYNPDTMKISTSNSVSNNTKWFFIDEKDIDEFMYNINYNLDYKANPEFKLKMSEDANRTLY